MARKILLADDSVTAQNMGRKILADAGYEVLTVNNGSAALKKISEQKPDLIVLDVYMPGYSGLEVCQRLKESGDTSRIPVLLTVGKLEPFKPEEAKRVRAEGFIVKPFEASELLSILSKLEDKIVPRSEGKTGRFARSIASIESSVPVDKNAGVEEDDSWKNRIAFPSKKKKRPDEEEDADPAATGPVKVALPSVFQPSAAQAAEKPGITDPADGRVDVKALETPGLPNDVTAEELAAIAAAAAQVAAAASASVPAPEFAVRESAPDIPSGVETEAPAATFADHKEVLENAAPAETALTELASPASEAGREGSGAESVSPVATRASSSGESVNGDDSWAVAGSGNGAGHSSEPTEAPVTMAVAGAPSIPSRWTAVAVALDASESALLLEQEMQMAATDAVAVAGNEQTIEGVSESQASTPEPSVEAYSGPTIVAARPTALEPVLSQGATEPVASFEHASLTQPGVDASEEIVAATSDLSVTSEPAAIATQVGDGDQSVPAASNEAEPLEAEVPQSLIAQASTSLSATALQQDAPVAENLAAAEPAAGGAEWRQIRESSEGKKDAEELAAMAAAAGAERSPEEASAEFAESPEIASIVDSVLNDLRPKIVAEISRKLGKKK
ncbi:MAG TPA: response regulator [Candidatus Sulfotelmatobacter sp.]|nr:response regulator [Candidatus Sulfotelmatobacter sp.]